MPDGKGKIFEWKGMPEKAQQILGEDFWYEINKMIPKQGPPIDIYKTDEQVVVVVETPGLMSADKLTIRIKGMKLFISGEIPTTYTVTEEEILQRERFRGSFKREILLPDDIVPDGPIEAQFKGGLVEIHIPRLTVGDEKEISINFSE
ncbi:MAG TPA: Hsp20/alpha crystallin family protein [Clostridia bacterium]|nr:Hsp20/alpha crystallin family protein [Clostridia bacterium]